MRVRTIDRASDFHTVESVGRTRELTKEGFLLCRDVRIARTGEMLYAADELPELEPGKDLIIRATRSEDDLFRPETIASFNGKAVTNGHPDDDVTPENWNELAVGVVMNTRRGEGADNQYMMADLLITDAATIKDILADGDLEVSNGYDAEYEQLGPGRARQHNIIGNHVARVDQGRCGPRCAIGDEDMQTRDKKRSWKDRIMTAFKARDEAALTEAMESAQDEMTNGVEGADESEGTTHRIVIEVAKPENDPGKPPAQAETTDEGEEAPPAWFTKFADDITGRLDALEKKGTTDEASDKEDKDDGEKTDDEDELDLGETRDEDGAEGDDKEDKGDKTSDRTRDSAGLKAVIQDFRSRAEILVPGINIPTFDAKDAAKRTTDRLCAMRRRILARAYDDAETSKVIAPLFPGKKPDFKALTCDGAATLFTAASEMVKTSNGQITTTGFVHDSGQGATTGSLAEINKRNREFWQAKGGLQK